MVPVVLGIAAIGAIILDGRRGEKSQRVQGREYAVGVDQRLQMLLDEWECYGTHDVRIGSGIYGGIAYVGGLRTEAEQVTLAGVGLSNAFDAAHAPHVHGGALDIWPVGFVPNRSFAEQPEADYEQLMAVFGWFAEQRGFVWGGRWAKPDMPHVELKDWQSLPLQGV